MLAGIPSMRYRPAPSVLTDLAVTVPGLTIAGGSGMVVGKAVTLRLAAGVPSGYRAVPESDPPGETRIVEDGGTRVVAATKLPKSIPWTTPLQQLALPSPKPDSSSRDNT